MGRKEVEEETVPALSDRQPASDGGPSTPRTGSEDSFPVGPTPEEEAALLTPDRTSEQYYSQPPRPENLEPEPAAASLPPMEDLVKRIPVAARQALDELFRAQFVTVKRVPKSALKV